MLKVLVLNQKKKQKKTNKKNKKTKIKTPKNKEKTPKQNTYYICKWRIQELSGC